MSRLKMRAGIAGASAALVALTTVGASGLAQAAPRPSETVLGGSTVPFTSHNKVIGYVSGSQALTVQLWLKPNLAAAQRFATEVATPGNRLFHHYLSPAAYTAKFGASRATATKVEAWLRGQGFTGVRTDAQRNYVRATATTARINAAFRVRETLYQPSAAANAGRYPLRANNRNVSLPTSLAGSVLGVTGLQNANPMLPLTQIKTKAHTVGGSSDCSQYYGQNVTTGLPTHFGTTSFPTEVCGYSADQLRAAYGASSAHTGTGQTIALVELGLTPDMFLTLQDYAAAEGMPAPSSSRYAELSLGKNTCGDPFDIEEQLDVESSYDMAPGANQLVVGGDSCNDGDQGLQGLFNADIAVLDGSGGHPLATIASNSWESDDQDQAPYLTNIENAYLVRAAGEGVGMYFSAGDGSGVLLPSSDPFATAVGGTTLGIGKANNREFETGWSTGLSLLNRAGTHWRFFGEQGASGGGPSLIWKEPAYQKGVVPPALATAPGNRGTARSVPDISADADPFTGMLIGFLVFPKKGAPVYTTEDVGGTSEASPLVAGIVTTAQQGQAVPFGFINPLLYKLYGTNAYYDTLRVDAASPTSWRGTYCPADTCGANLLTQFDDQNPNMFPYTGQVTLPGYDNMTGVGTPNAPNFIMGLRELSK
jgi:subtilase family serine protease